MNLFKLLKSMLSPSPRLSPAECQDRVRSGKALLVDVREPREWEAGIAQSASILPLSDLTGKRERWGKFLIESKNKEILLYCAAGARAGMAAKLLVSEGFNATNTGSLSDWAGSGWPVGKPGKVR